MTQSAAMKSRLVPIAITAAVLSIAACSKSEPPKKAAANPSPAAAAPQQPAAKLQPSAEEIDAALKERLARQEAASKLFDRPAPPAPPPPAPAPVAPAKVAPAVKPAPEPVRKAEPAPLPAPPPPVAESAKPEPPRPTVAAVAPAQPAPAQPAPALPRVLARVEPDYPGSAPDQGFVKARLTLDNNGNVTRVDVTDAQPRRVFDRAVVRALSQWKFNEGPSGRTFDTEIVFRR